MKLVAKYTLVFGAVLTAALTLQAVYRVEHLRGELVDDMQHDHRVVGHVLQLGIADLWLDVPQGDRASITKTELLIQRANDNDTATRFEWIPRSSPVESQRIEGEDFVSRFPIRAGSASAGVVVAREPIEQIDRLIRAQVVLSVIGIASIVVFGLIASSILGRWLVGRPVALLVEQARRIGRREFANDVAFRRSDELGELAIEMSATSKALSDALALATVEADARLKAVEQLRHSDRLSTVGRLAAGIAHELGTPLSIVGGHAQMIFGGEVTGDAALDSARVIDREVTRMGKIVRQLLDFARRKEPEGTTCEPNEVAVRCVSLLGVMAERAAVRTEVVHAVPSLRAGIDEDSLQQVLTNLIVNAIQAMPAGGLLRVVVERTQSSPPGSTNAPAPCVRVDVSDTGGGISDEAREHIFEPFFTTKQVGDGTGLGLAVVQGIVADHQGWITVQTNARGTTFSIYLQGTQC